MHALLAAASGLLLLLALPFCTPVADAAKVQSFQPAEFIPGQDPSTTEMSEAPFDYKLPRFLESFTEPFYCGFVDGIGKFNYFNDKDSTESGRVQELCRQIVRHCQLETTKFCENREACNDADMDALGNTCFFNALPDDPGFYENLMQRVGTGGANFATYKQCRVQKIIAPYVRADDLPFFMCLAHKKSAYHTLGHGAGHHKMGFYGLFGLTSKYGWCKHTDTPYIKCDMDCTRSENFNLKDDLHCVFEVLRQMGINGFGSETRSECCTAKALENYSNEAMCGSKYSGSSYLHKSPPTPYPCTGGENALEYKTYWHEKDFGGLGLLRQAESRRLGAPLPTGLDSTPMKVYKNLFGDKDDAPDVAPNTKRARRMAQSVLDFLEQDATINGGGYVDPVRNPKARKGRAPQLTEEDKRRQEIRDICLNYDESRFKSSAQEYREDKYHQTLMKKVKDLEYYELGENERSFDEEFGYEVYDRSGRSISYDEEDDDQYNDDNDGPKLPRYGKTEVLDRAAISFHDSDADESEGSQDVQQVPDEDLRDQRRRRSPAGIYSQKYDCAIIFDAERRAAYKGAVCSDDSIEAFMREGKSGTPLEY